MSNFQSLEVVGRGSKTQRQVAKKQTLSGLNLPLSSSSTTSRNCCRNSRLVVDEDDLLGFKNSNFRSKGWVRLRLG